jgi:hypothetical protein
MRHPSESLNNPLPRTRFLSAQTDGRKQEVKQCDTTRLNISKIIRIADVPHEQTSRRAGEDMGKTLLTGKRLI